jgi:hypothetical protein
MAEVQKEEKKYTKKIQQEVKKEDTTRKWPQYKKISHTELSNAELCHHHLGHPGLHAIKTPGNLSKIPLQASQKLPDHCHAPPMGKALQVQILWPSLRQARNVMKVPTLEPVNRFSRQGPAAVPPAGKTIPAVPVIHDSAALPDSSGTNDASDYEDIPHAMLPWYDPTCTLCAHQGVPAAPYDGAVTVIEFILRSPPRPPIKLSSPPPGCPLLGTASDTVGSEAVGPIGVGDCKYIAEVDAALETENAFDAT